MICVAAGIWGVPDAQNVVWEPIRMSPSPETGAPEPPSPTILLGKQENLECLEIRRPDGQVQRLDSPGINRYHQLTPGQR
jgi:hypothetical protein